MRTARFNDPFADIIVSGHIHTSGYGTVSHPYPRDWQPGEMNENLIHCCQTTSFKECDSYAEWRHFPRSTYLQAPTFIIFPDSYGLARPYQIMMVPHPKLASEILTKLRGQPERKDLKAARQKLKLVA